MSEEIAVVIFCVETVAEGAEVEIGKKVYVTRPTTWNRAIISSLCVALLVSSCSRDPHTKRPTEYSIRAVATNFDLGDATRFEYLIGGAVSDSRHRLLVSYAKIEKATRKKQDSLFRISTDDGASFGPEHSFSGSVRLVENGLASVSAVAALGGTNIRYSRSFDDGVSWTKPTQINDEEGSVRPGWGGSLNFVQPTDTDVYCLWTDRRRGFISLFSSASHDGGLTWSPNQAVEYDFREGEQSAPQLLMGAGGRLIAIWIDWRDRQTLADIRSSYSDDGGRHWSASQKVSDDTEHVWQVEPSVVARGNKVFVAFRDFREAGEEGDNDWNIYFARSKDNAATWEKNVRVNDIQQGEDSDPRLTVDEHGTLWCAWKTGRQSIFGDIALSHSADDGRSWSASAVLNEGRELMARQPLPLIPLSGGRLLCAWLESGFESNRSQLAWLEPATELASAASREANSGRTPDIVGAPSPGEVVFSDDFSNGSKDRWQVTSGLWTVVDGTFMGVELTAQSAFSSYARVEEPDRYIVLGRFKLDPVAHYAAQLNFRWDPVKNNYYHITSRFRFGVWMGLRDGDPRAHASGSQLSSRPLAQRRFPFQNNRWYEFALVVAPERIDFFIDGRLMLSHAEQLKLPPGRFGVGGASRAPTYFDDILIARPAVR